MGIGCCLRSFGSILSFVCVVRKCLKQTDIEALLLMIEGLWAQLPREGLKKVLRLQRQINGQVNQNQSGQATIKILLKHLKLL